MGRIISEDATNIFFPQTCDVLVDDVEDRTISRKYPKHIFFNSISHDNLRSTKTVWRDWVTGEMVFCDGA